MPLSLSDYLDVDRSLFDSNKVFDVILDYDSLFFINFQRVKDSSAPEFSESYERIRTFYREIGILLKNSMRTGDRFYREASKRLNMTELQEICLGYSKHGTAGSGSGHKLKTILLTTGKQILDAGLDDPEIFELVGLFEDNIGPDRISDTIGHIILKDIVEYTKRIITEFTDPEKFSSLEKVGDLLKNPYSGKAILVLPQDILHELPIAKEWEDIDHVCALNQEVRDKVNQIIGDEWKGITVEEKKGALKKVLLTETDLFAKLISDYKESTLSEYDFTNDPLGESIWHPIAKECSQNHPLNFSVKSISSQTELLQVIREICNHFKALVENNGLNKVFFTDEGKPRKEWVIQRTFQAIATSYCTANGIDMSPEVNSGRGPVDFKFSYGSFKALLEVKLTTNPNIIHGYEKQLKEYEKSERVDDSFYLVIINGGSDKKIIDLIAIHEDYERKGIKMHELFLIDAMVKPSASKYQLHMDFSEK